MPMTQQVMRGNLASNPSYFPASVDAEGNERPAMLEATIYRDRRQRMEDGTWQDSPLGPEKVGVKFYRQNAELLHDAGFRQGDPVVATGQAADPEAYISKQDGHPHAMQIMAGSTLCGDEIRMQLKVRHDTQQSLRQAQTNGSKGELTNPAKVTDIPDPDPVQTMDRSFRTCRGRGTPTRAPQYEGRPV